MLIVDVWLSCFWYLLFYLNVLTLSQRHTVLHCLQVGPRSFFNLHIIYLWSFLKQTEMTTVHTLTLPIHTLHSQSRHHRQRGHPPPDPGDVSLCSGVEMSIQPPFLLQRGRLASQTPTRRPTSPPGPMPQMANRERGCSNKYSYCF